MRWEGTTLREGESGAPQEQRETLDQRRERETVAKGTPPGPASSGEGSSRGPGDGEPGLPPRAPVPRPQARRGESPAPETQEQRPGQDGTAPPTRLTRTNAREWLLGGLSKGPVPLATIYQAADAARVPRARIREARLTLPIVEYPTPAGEQLWLLLVDGHCINCGKALHCRECGQHALMPPGIEPVWPLQVTAKWLGMKPSSLRAVLSRSRGEFPTRYKKGRGGRPVRVLTLTEIETLYHRTYRVRRLVRGVERLRADLDRRNERNREQAIRESLRRGK